ncbi:hypothetical protein ONZ51_g9037 [Trametes cubensis]|uniref:Uncharacterized protein n=1 Tax=Trametes cubensis TaxID=1111947 RepID=A0AAD7TMH8_9APHY|nr:hypothetical protein ONZ51_g9037 [Trametes cubensis]
MQIDSGRESEGARARCSEELAAKIKREDTPRRACVVPEESAGGGAVQALWALGARDDGTNAGEREPRLDISIAHGLSGKSRTETRAQLERPEVGSGSSISCVQSYYSAGEPPVFWNPTPHHTYILSVPLPPPPTTVTKNVEEPRGRCGFFRGTGDDRLGYVNSNGDIFVVPNNPFGISITRIMVAYHLRWPEASVRTTMAASLLIDDVIARRGNFPAFKIEAERTPTTYREALGNESDLVNISLDVFRPEVVERNQNIIVHA